MKDGSDLLEKELLDEAIFEISDLVENVEGIIISLEENIDLLDEDTYELIMRNVHSIKGALGMIGYENESNLVHELETFFIKTYLNQKVNNAVISIFIDVWGKLINALEGHPIGRTYINSFIRKINCLESEKEKKHGKLIEAEMAVEMLSTHREHLIHYNIKRGLNFRYNYLFIYLVEDRMFYEFVRIVKKSPKRKWENPI